MTGSDDARERPVEITPAGRAKLEQAFPAWQAAQREATAKWKGLRVS
jgi:DNA-binding MarR family transcriptional regulator